MNIVCLYPIQYSSHWPLVATQRLKCGQCDRRTEFSLLWNYFLVLEINIQFIKAKKIPQDLYSPYAFNLAYVQYSSIRVSLANLAIPY